MYKAIMNFLKDEDGIIFAEYALLGVSMTAVAAAVSGHGPAIAAAINNVGNFLSGNKIHIGAPDAIG